ncbi:MAG: methyltransferase, FxLD system [Ktedonobacteraceae bacterium]
MDGNNDDRRKPDVEKLHQGLVDQLKSQGHIADPLVEAAFRAVPRHLFLPDKSPAEVYRDEAIATKFLDGSSISASSQPAIMAIMLEQLQLKPGLRVLEIGAGTGYNAALMAYIVGETGQVITVDIDEDIVDNARTHLITAGFERVWVICADGGAGYAHAAPYDRIILTVGASDITPAWHDQLKPGGRLLLPLTLREPQVSVAFEQVDDHLASVSVRACGFMMLRGAFAEPTFRVQLGPEPLLFLWLREHRFLDTDTVYQWLTGPGRDRATGVKVMPRELFFGLHMWLALHEADYCQVIFDISLVEQGIIPLFLQLFTTSKFTSSFGLLGDSGICVLTRPLAQFTSEENTLPTTPFEVYVKSFGPDESLASRLIELVSAWNAAGHPTEEHLHIKAYPRAVAYTPAANEMVIQKQWTQLAVSWELP